MTGVFFRKKGFCEPWPLAPGPCVPGTPGETEVSCHPLEGWRRATHELYGMYFKRDAASKLVKKVLSVTLNHGGGQMARAGIGACRPSVGARGEVRRAGGPESGAERRAG